MIAKASIVYALCACLAGCAAPGSSLTAVSAHNARDAITIGKSTKSDVIAALGKTAVVSFGSGFEVWVYQVTSDTPANLNWRRPGTAEFVVLFAPSGVVTKTRIRPPPLPSGAKGT
jgi:hypothetical protein